MPSKLIESWISVGTFVMAAVYGIRGLMAKRKDTLDKVITVHFKIKDPSDDEWKYIFTCHKFSLAGVGDIRSVAQQIGSQMANKSRLDFTPNYDEEPPVEIRHKGQDVMHYEVTFYLTALPSNYAMYHYKVWWWRDRKKENGRLVLDKLYTTILSEGEARTIKKHKRFSPVLVNISNHLFNDEQKAAAEVLLEEEKEYQVSEGSMPDGENTLLHEPFPHIPPTLSSEKLEPLVMKYVDILMRHRPIVVVVNGEFTFCYRLIRRLENEGVKCYTSTTERNVIVEGDTKTTVFKHIQFRPYT